MLVKQRGRCAARLRLRFIFFVIDASLMVLVVIRHKYRGYAALNIGLHGVAVVLAFLVNALDTFRLPHAEDSRHVLGLQIAAGFNDALGVRQQYPSFAQLKSRGSVVMRRDTPSALTSASNISTLE